MRIRLPLDLPGVDRDDYETWPEVRLCDSEHHNTEPAGPQLATRLLHWVTGPVDYCDACAAWMLRVAETLCTHVHAERCRRPTFRRRRHRRRF